MSRRRQGGVALIMAMIVLVLCAQIGAEIAWDTHLEARRAMSLMALEQARLYALGAESWASDILRTDLEESPEQDHLGELWAVGLPVLPIDEADQIQGGTLRGSLEDMQGRFNVNNLITPAGQVNEEALAQFRRILRTLGLDEQLAGRVLDWLDPESEPHFPGGAEDDFYTAAQPAYRTANRPITSVSELRAVAGFTPEAFTALAPHITALPVGTPINVNTATPVVLGTLSDDMSSVELLLQQRAELGFGDLETFADSAGLEHLPENLSLTSSYFRAVVQVTVGQTQLTLYSLLARGPNGTHSILRQYGTE